MTSDLWAGLSPPYATIVADPPWDFGVDGTRWPTRSRTPGKWQGPNEWTPMHYSTMPVEDIAALPVATLTDTDCRLFLWTTNRHLPAALNIMDAWRFKYRQTLVWHKLDSLGGSVAPNAEFLLVGIKGSPVLLGRASSAVHSHAQAKTHSAKPRLFGDLIEQVSPGPYVELFARQTRMGWDSWGYGYESAVA